MTLPVSRFVIHVAERLPPVGPIGPLVASLSLAEFYLTCACLQGMASAHEAFEWNYLAKLPEKLRSLKQPDAMIDHVCQTCEMAPLFRVDQSTISRWLKSARQHVHEETRRLLQERLGLSTPGFKSFLAFIGSQMDLNISQLLAEKGVVLPPTDG